MTVARKLITALFLIPLLALPAAAQQPDDLEAIRKEMESIRKTQESIQKDLQEIKTLLRTRPAGPQRPNPADIKVNIDGEPTRGEKTASLVLVEYSDYQ